MQTGSGHTRPPWARSNVNLKKTGLNSNRQTMDPNMMPQQVDYGARYDVPFQPTQPLIHPSTEYNPSMTQAQGGMSRQLGRMPINQTAGEMRMNQTIGHSNQTPPNTERRVFTGIVTLVHSDFGYIDSDVFYLNSDCVNGIIPEVDDRVFVEAIYNPSISFNWKADSVRVLPSKNNQLKSNSYKAAPPLPNSKKLLPHTVERSSLLSTSIDPRTGFHMPPRRIERSPPHRVEWLPPQPRRIERVDKVHSNPHNTVPPPAKSKRSTSLHSDDCHEPLHRREERVNKVPKVLAKESLNNNKNQPKSNSKKAVPPPDYSRMSSSEIREGADRVPKVLAKKSLNSNKNQAQSNSKKAVPPPDYSRMSSSEICKQREPQIAEGADRKRIRTRSRSRARPRSRMSRSRARSRSCARSQSRARSRSRARSQPRARPRSRSRDRRDSRNSSCEPQRKRPRWTPRFSLFSQILDFPNLSNRYANLYVPSDFCNVNVKWGQTFPPKVPFPLNIPCRYHIMNEEIEDPNPNDAVLEPPDSDYRFIAKVMLISLPTLESLYQICLAKSDETDKRCPRHPTQLIKFLVGQKGKGGENFAIGGPWSPSLDGENPESDPSVLVRTAIRTCKALTGIDLTACTQWYRMVEFYYWRERDGGSSSSKSRLETVVLFLPDVWSAQPSRIEWTTVSEQYKAACEAALQRLENPAEPPPAPAPPAARPQSSEPESEPDADADKSQIEDGNDKDTPRPAQSASAPQKSVGDLCEIDDELMIITDILNDEEMDDQTDNDNIQTAISMDTLKTEEEMPATSYHSKLDIESGQLTICQKDGNYEGPPAPSKTEVHDKPIPNDPCETGDDADNTLNREDEKPEDEKSEVVETKEDEKAEDKTKEDNKEEVKKAEENEDKRKEENKNEKKETNEKKNEKLEKQVKQDQRKEDGNDKNTPPPPQSAPLETGTADKPPNDLCEIVDNPDNIQNMVNPIIVNYYSETAITIYKTEDDKKNPEPTYYSKLNIKTMKVTELRRELQARKVNSNGVRSALVSRLSKLLKDEEAKETQNDLASMGVEDKYSKKSGGKKSEVVEIKEAVVTTKEEAIVKAKEDMRIEENKDEMKEIKENENIEKENKEDQRERETEVDDESRPDNLSEISNDPVDILNKEDMGYQVIDGQTPLTIDITEDEEGKPDAESTHCSELDTASLEIKVNDETIPDDLSEIIDDILNKNEGDGNVIDQIQETKVDDNLIPDNLSEISDDPDDILNREDMSDLNNQPPIIIDITEDDEEEPTHYSKLDINTMEVTYLRRELRARKVNSKGDRSILVSRLSKLLAAEEIIETQKDEEVMEVEDEDELETEKQLIKARYVIPDEPHIIVHPRALAKGGKYSCKVVALSLLLDYRITDKMKHSFELSVFAELFVEMLMRDFGCYIYKTLYTLPEKAEVNEKEKSAEKKDKKDSHCDKERRRHRVKLPADPYLLLSLVYFDTNRCGYISKIDLQDLFTGLGLQLSRSQIKSILEKVCIKDNFNYETLIQAIKDLAPGTPEAIQDLHLDPTNVSNEVPPYSTLEASGAAGDRELLPLCNREAGETKDVSDTGLVMYKARLVDVSALIAAEARAAAMRARLEESLQKMRKALEAARKSASTPVQAESSAQHKASSSSHSVKLSAGAAQDNITSSKAKCIYCHIPGHGVAFCSDFKEQPVVVRRWITLDRKLCFNCLEQHLTRDCASSNDCELCQEPHHYLLCLKREGSVQDSLKQNRAIQDAREWKKTVQDTLDQRIEAIRDTLKRKRAIQDAREWKKTVQDTLKQQGKAIQDALKRKGAVVTLDLQAECNAQHQPSELSKSTRHWHPEARVASPAVAPLTVASPTVAPPTVTVAPPTVAPPTVTVASPTVAPPTVASPTVSISSVIMEHSTNPPDEDNAANMAPKCIYCSGADHVTTSCTLFKAQPVKVRRGFALKRKLCFRCLGTHLARDCTVTDNCWFCQGPHHDVLCLNENATEEVPPEVQAESNVHHQITELRESLEQAEARVASLTAPSSSKPPEQSAACPYCLAPGHEVTACALFKAQPVQDRREAAREQKWCFRCLGLHLARECSHPDCGLCGEAHHEWLCVDSKASSSSDLPEQSAKCLYCLDPEHELTACPLFEAQPVQARRVLVRKRQWCFRCLGQHLARECLRPDCELCGGAHHVLVCKNFEASAQPEATPDPFLPMYGAFVARSATFNDPDPDAGIIQIID